MSGERASAFEGQSYRNGNGAGRLLVVARLIPSAANTPTFGRVGTGLDATRTQDYIDGRLKHRQFTDLARAVLGRAAARRDCERFWASVSLANPAPDGDWAGQLQDWLRQLEPTTILVLGDLELPAVAGLDGLSVLRLPHPGSPGFAFRDHVDTLAPVRARLAE